MVNPPSNNENTAPAATSLIPPHLHHAILDGYPECYPRGQFLQLNYSSVVFEIPGVSATATHPDYDEDENTPTYVAAIWDTVGPQPGLHVTCSASTDNNKSRWLRSTITHYYPNAIIHVPVSDWVNPLTISL